MEPLFCFVFYLPLPSRSQVRVSQEQEHFLLNPFGLLYSEVTASSLIKVDMQVRIYLKPANACRRAYAKSSACDAEFDRFFFYHFSFIGQCGRPGNNELWSQHCRFRPPFGHPCRTPGRQMRRPRSPSRLRRCE